MGGTFNPIHKGHTGIARCAYEQSDIDEILFMPSEMYRVLKPGGALCVLEFSTPPNPLMRLGYRIYLRWGIPAWGKLVTGDASGFVYLAKSIKAFPDQEGFTKMLKDAGFSRVEYTNVTFGVAAVHIAYKE